MARLPEAAGEIDKGDVQPDAGGFHDARVVGRGYEQYFMGLFHNTSIS
jgi:hypothetical protein